jgi:hypothetical protein
VRGAGHFVADRVAVAERREDLVDGRAAHCSTAPSGTPERIWVPGGSAFFRRAK